MRRRTRTRRRSRRVGGVGEEEEEEEEEEDEEAVIWTAQDLTFNGGPTRFTRACRTYTTYTHEHIDT